MPNTYFQFKQFTVHQEHCAMKVCTDACLFGAWVAGKVKMQKSKFKNVLDIGTGTGLLSLMIAQVSEADTDAVEIDEAAAEQAGGNFRSSPWANRLHIVKGDIKCIELPKKYDLIISNPPFFENSLKSNDSKRNLALHSNELGLEELIRIASNHLADEGIFSVLMPFERKEECIRIAAAYELFAESVIDMRQTTKHGFFRTMLCFSKKQEDPVHSEISIKEGNVYHPEFILLLKDYYHHL